MFSTLIQPRSIGTDCLGHINNDSLPPWFETARTPILRIFVPDMIVKMESFPLIIAHTEYEFMDQIFSRYEVEIRSWISRIGKKSFTIYHEAWQRDRLCVKGSAVVVYYDFQAKQSVPLPKDKRNLLKMHLLHDK